MNIPNTAGLKIRPGRSYWLGHGKGVIVQEDDGSLAHYTCDDYTPTEQEVAKVCRTWASQDRYTESKKRKAR